MVAVGQTVFNNCTHRVRGTRGDELRVAVRNGFHPKDVILRRGIDVKEGRPRDKCEFEGLFLYHWA